MCRRCLTISERLDDQARVAANCGLIGMIEAARGEMSEALRWHVRALTILKQLQDRQAETEELGILARYRAALGANQFLTILTEITNDANQARSIISSVKKQKSAGGSGFQP